MQPAQFCGLREAVRASADGLVEEEERAAGVTRGAEAAVGGGGVGGLSPRLVLCSLAALAGAGLVLGWLRGRSKLSESPSLCSLT